MVIEALGIADRLKAATRDAHIEAERHPFQVALMEGRLSRDVYASQLGQMLHVHRGLEHCLRACVEPRVRGVVDEWQFQEANLRADFEFFGGKTVEPQPFAETTALLAKIRASADACPVSLLGYHYVTEGSKNGGKFIAVRVRAAYALNGTEGTRSLDPYGAEQPVRWKSVRERLQAVTLDESEAGLVIQAAQDMFRGIISIFTRVQGG